MFFHYCFQRQEPDHQLGMGGHIFVCVLRGLAKNPTYPLVHQSRCFKSTESSIVNYSVEKQQAVRQQADK